MADLKSEEKYSSVKKAMCSRYYYLFVVISAMVLTYLIGPYVPIAAGLSFALIAVLVFLNAVQNNKESANYIMVLIVGAAILAIVDAVTGIEWGTSILASIWIVMLAAVLINGLMSALLAAVLTFVTYLEYCYGKVIAII